MDTIEYDVLVLGGGMSGLACAHLASQAGAKVLVCEKQAKVGGSANFSAGMFWAPQDLPSLRAWVPDGDPELQQAWMSDYYRAVQWMRTNGVPTASRFGPVMTIGIGYPVSIPKLYELHSQRIQSSNTGSKVLTNTAAVTLVQEQPGVAGSRILGAIVRSQTSPESPVTFTRVLAKTTVLATGGFQGSPALTSRHLGPDGDNIFVRANKGSVGDGLTLAQAAGAGTSRGLATYYGHLLASPVKAQDVDPMDYIPLAQYQSKYCLLVNELGKRFADETTGDEIVNQVLAKQPGRRGFLLFDEQIRAKHCVTAMFPNAGAIDRLEKARTYGCRVASASTLAALLEIVASWGCQHSQLKETVATYANASSDSSVLLDAPTGRGGPAPTPLVEGQGPFFAMEVQPSITFTYGGIRIDREGSVLTPDGAPIPGLLSCGVDAGGFSNTAYAGGLALSFVTGVWAAQAAARLLRLPVPQLPEADSKDVGAPRVWRESRL